MESLSYFVLDEFTCPCCLKNHIDSDFVKLLNNARHIAGIPFKITSGYRCEKHNKSVGGSPNSSHLTGNAADISAISSQAKFMIIRSLLDVGFKRIGVSSNFIHVDNSDTLVQNVMWTY